MDRLNKLRGEAGDSRDTTLDTSSPPSEAFMSANESSSKYFSLSEVDSTFSISPSKDTTVSAAADADPTVTEDTDIISTLSPIPKKSDIESYKIGKHIEAANILSGGVNIFEDNDNSYDGDELVIDDNVTLEEEKSSAELKLSEGALVPLEKTEEPSVETIDETEAIPSKDTEVVLQIDGNNVDAIDIGNGLYLYRKAGEEELAAVQIIDDDQQQPSFKFLKVRENTEGNLEVYEEIEVEIPKEVPTKVGSYTDKTAHVPIKDINKVISEPSNKVIDKVNKTPKIDSNTTLTLASDSSIDVQSEVNLNGKMMKFNESRKSPLTFTPMTYHSTPNKEGIPLTKTMVDQQLHPSRHSDNIKKTIEVHTDSSKTKLVETSIKNKEMNESTKMLELDTSVADTEECNSEMTVAETSQNETELVNNNVNEAVCISSDHVDNKQNKESPKDITEIKTISENDKCTTITSQESEVNAEQNVLECTEVINSNIRKETENPIEDNNMTSQNIIETSKDSTQCSEKEKYNKDEMEPPSRVNENIDSKTNVCDKKLNNQTSNETESNKHIDHAKNKHMENLTADNLLNTNAVDEAVTLTTEPIENNNLTEEHTCKNDDAPQLIDPIINQAISDKKPNLSSTTELKVNIENKNIQETKNEELIISRGDNKNKAETDIDSSKITSKDTTITQTALCNKPIESRKEVPKTKVVTKPNNCNSAVPFGKWTEANRQEFLNKIKETKVTTNNSNTNQIKQPNDLNRRDVLKKFDSQRQSAVPAKVPPDFGSVPKFSSKTDTTAFVTKSTTIQQSNPIKPVIPSLKTQTAVAKQLPAIPKKVVKEEPLKTEILLQTTIINSQKLIDKTIEGIITNALKIKTIPDHLKEQKTIHTVENPKDATPLPGSLDDIEMKMNELHGMSFIERPINEPCPKLQKNDSKSNEKSENLNINNIKIPNLLPFKTKEQHKIIKESTRDDTSDEEIIEHEPITGDIDTSKQNLISLLSSKEKPLITKETKKDTIITEKDFDKFARRNSITYEDCLTVNFDGKEQHNVIQTIVEKDTSVKKLSRNELLLAESKAKSSSKQGIAARHNNQISKIPTLKSSGEEESYNKNHPSKVQIAYQTALTAKRHMECPITIIEDKPVKVLYMDSHTEFIPTQLNVQGQELSPSNNQKTDSDVHSASESVDSDILDSLQDTKSPDDTKSKSKHQRKQVLTPVEEEPEIQLIEPSDLGIKVSPTKKRRIEEKADKQLKNLVPKKSYLLNRSVVEEHTSKHDQSKIKFKESDNRSETFIGRTDAITAIDNLVKAAELIETQSENNSTDVIATETTEIPQNTPVKRGRGRPRKYPLPEPGSDVTKPLSPQKKPRLIDSKVTRSYTDSDESSDGEIVKENWTMGKINENIVCPICNKLFRSENVVFKHVKHCTGPSPNRSDSDKRSPRRLRNSQDRLRDSRSDNTSSDDEEKIKSHRSNYNVSKSVDDNADIIVIEDTPIKQKSTEEKVNNPESKKVLRKTKHLHNTNNLICEICGKTFRQLSYLVSHKLQHKNEDTKKLEGYITSKSVFSCEVCKKEFRKLHHLVQHRIIHNPMPSRLHRKTSSELRESKNSKAQNDDASAGFRCEPCDKSFRKLHHLVEHRETHDGINKKGNTVTSQSTTESSKASLVHYCDVCKKVFKKLQDLLEHKELHYETSSEKSDDKSVKSSLSTKDIIHECSLCYMVFPNEHSLNKHTVICLRKKKQSAAKQAAKQAEGQETIDTENLTVDANISQDVEIISDVQEDSDVTEQTQKSSTNNVQDDPVVEKVTVLEDGNIKEQLEGMEPITEEKQIKMEAIPKKRHSNVTEKIKIIDDIETPAKIKKVDDKEHITIPDTPTPKKKIHKDKFATVTKRHKTVNAALPVVHQSKPSVESSDDDEVRYMFNPNFKEDESTESKVFMKIRALKRNSLQIERPNSKDLVKRRISLQHPPKMPRLKAKAVEAKPPTAPVEKKLKLKAATEPTISTDSDDSDVKYSFPEKSHTEDSKSAEKKGKRQSLTVKRKSLIGIAKRKSLGKLPTPPNKPKKRTADIEHRCDCGQLFSSAALLARHTTLAHTPPRIRRRRSPPPDPQPPKTKPPTTKTPNTKPPNTKIPITKPKPNTQSKNPKSDVTNSNKPKIGVATRKSSVSNSEGKTPNDVGKSVKIEHNFKSLRSAMRGMPAGKKPAEKKK